jgi:hypothetical protein
VSAPVAHEKHRADSDACSLETTRLWPAIPNGLQRTPPPDGGPVVVAGQVVPVGTTVQIPTWSRTRLSCVIAPRATDA